MGERHTSKTKYRFEVRVPKRQVLRKQKCGCPQRSDLCGDAAHPSFSQRRCVPKLANLATSTELAIAVRRSFHQAGTGLVAGSEEVRQEPRFPRSVGILIARWVPGARLDGLRER